MADITISKKRWSDLSPQQQASIGVVGLIQIALLAAAVDIRRRPAFRSAATRSCGPWSHSSTSSVPWHTLCLDANEGRTGTRGTRRNWRKSEECAGTWIYRQVPLSSPSSPPLRLTRPTPRADRPGCITVSLTMRPSAHGGLRGRLGWPCAGRGWPAARRAGHCRPGRRRLTIWRLMPVSTLAVEASSARIGGGLVAEAEAMAASCCWPPDSSAG